MVFFYLVTTEWVFDISLCKNPIKNKQSIKVVPNGCCLGGSPWTDQYAHLSDTHYRYEVGMLKVPDIVP